MRIVVPFAADRPKTRLAGVLSPDERADFAGAMLRDVLRAVRRAGHEPTVLATAPTAADAPVVVDDRPLSAAVNGAIEGSDGPVGVVMSDLALATPASVERLCAAEGDVVIAPGRGGGTNALVIRHPAFRVDYHGASYLDHRRAAREIGASVREVDSMRLATDVDEPSDLAELLLHGDGAARDWLTDAGFELDVRDGRVGVRRVR
ncbi:2-phospho-L-lactate guanylyltransferase [Halegenticoccus tardaugens]|uniref:2-phospho-L-lactate guanylyltransferase n=1 Tax=Halegenticoccus tardaugens TaxID=2071624 RepID=UPI00100BE460|nr:2-phospho-L-lactate guanylyltransferase [Halegenticoccus tardaugens]